MSQQQDLADQAYERIRLGFLSAATLVEETNRKWQSTIEPASVNFFVSEVAANLLRCEDVDVGDLCNGNFVTWGLAPWDAEERIEQLLTSLSGLYGDSARIVFAIKKPN